MSPEQNKAIVRRIYEELWDGRDLGVADEVIAAEGYVNYDTGLVPAPGGPEDMKQTVRMVTVFGLIVMLAVADKEVPS